MADKISTKSLEKRPLLVERPFFLPSLAPSLPLKFNPHLAEKMSNLLGFH